VNPVDVWEGIDTQIETGRNSLVKLAIHILTIIVNSAGCERAFSHMGLVQTGIRSQLGVEKVRKTTMVGMDIKRSHKDAGLLRPRKPRNFDAISDDERESDETGTSIEAGESEDILEFTDLANELIASAATADADSDTDMDDDADLPSTPLPIPTFGTARPTRLPATATSIPSTAAPAHPPVPPSTQPRRTTVGAKIPLETLFVYPVDLNAPSNGMDFFWSGGIKNLAKEMVLHEIICSAGDNVDEGNPDVHMASTSA
jgi:hypothetical protein